MRGLRFSQWWWCRFTVSGIWCRVDLYIGTNVSEELSDSIFRLDSSASLGRMYNSYTTRLESSRYYKFNPHITVKNQHSFMLIDYTNREVRCNNPKFFSLCLWDRSRQFGSGVRDEQDRDSVIVMAHKAKGWTREDSNFDSQQRQYFFSKTSILTLEPPGFPVQCLPGLFSPGQAAGVWSWPRLLVSRVRMSGSVPPLPLYLHCVQRRSITSSF